MFSYTRQGIGGMKTGESRQAHKAGRFSTAAKGTHATLSLSRQKGRLFGLRGKKKNKRTCSTVQTNKEENNGISIESESLREKRSMAPAYVAMKRKGGNGFLCRRGNPHEGKARQQ